MFQLLNIFLSTDLVLSDLAYLKTQGRQSLIPQPFLALICSQQFSIWFYSRAAIKSSSRLFRKVKPIKA